MIHYEIYVTGRSNPYYSFDSAYSFTTGEKLFVPDNQVQQLVITKITHDLTSGKHVVRLTCQFKKTFV